MDGQAQPPILNIGRPMLNHLAALAGGDPSIEICGILLGDRSPAAVTVQDFVASPNVAQGDRTREFEIDPQLLVQALFAHRGGRPGPVGFYHSHPAGNVAPSARDAAAAWTDMSYLIIATTGPGELHAASWWKTAAGERFTRQRMVHAVLATKPAPYYDH